eukprot:662320-Hanusia_phi.AAC.1
MASWQLRPGRASEVHGSVFPISVPLGSDSPIELPAPDLLIKSLCIARVQISESEPGPGPAARQRYGPTVRFQESGPGPGPWPVAARPPPAR